MYGADDDDDDAVDYIATLIDNLDVDKL